MRDIIPKNKIKGVDFCGDGTFTYIIRSDLGCYMRTSDLQKGSDLTIFKLHPSCQHGDHYCTDRFREFYIIKGKSYRRVSDLSTDADAHVFTLNSNCQGADHYIYMGGVFIFRYFQLIINGTLRTKQIMLGIQQTEIHLNSTCTDGLYYWCVSDQICFLKPVSEWGVQYFKGTDLEKGIGQVYSVHPDVVNFLPGGLSITQGPAFSRWETIKTISNDSDTAVTWRKKIIKKVGYNKEKMTQITNNWKIGASSIIESGVLASLIAKIQFSLSAEYGGSKVNIVNETWDEATEEEEQLSFELKPHKSLYLWQYRLGVGDEPMLFYRDLIISDQPNPPTEAPLPPADA